MSKIRNKQLELQEIQRLVSEDSADHDLVSPSFYIPPTPSNNTSFPIEKLIDYLTNEKAIILTDHKVFDNLTFQVLLETNDQELLRIVQDHGWNGSKFIFTDDNPFDIDAMIQELSNLYLKQKNSYFSLRIRDLFFSDDSIGLEQIVSFCPKILYTHFHRLGIAEETVITSQSFSFIGACMIADISGFSRFSGEMCSKGINGLDSLKEITNGFLGHFVETVHEYNGDGKLFSKVQISKLFLIIFLLNSYCICRRCFDMYF